MGTKNEDAKTENGDSRKVTDKSDAKNALAVLCTRVVENVGSEVSKHTYKHLRSHASLQLGGERSAEVLRSCLEKYLIDQRFKQQLEEFEKQIKAHKTDADPEDFYNLEETLRDFKDNYVDL